MTAILISALLCHHLHLRIQHAREHQHHGPFRRSQGQAHPRPSNWVTNLASITIKPSKWVNHRIFFWLESRNVDDNMPFNVLPVLRITCIRVWTECKYGSLMHAWRFFCVNEVLRNKLLFGVLHQCVAVLDHLTSQPSCWNNLPPQNERFVRSKFIISRLMPRNKGRINTAKQMQQIC